MSKHTHKAQASEEDQAAEDLAAESFDTDAAIATDGDDVAAVAGYLDAAADLTQMGDD